MIVIQTFILISMLLLLFIKSVPFNLNLKSQIAIILSLILLHFIDKTISIILSIFFIIFILKINTNSSSNANSSIIKKSNVEHTEPETIIYDANKLQTDTYINNPEVHNRIDVKPSCKSKHNNYDNNEESIFNKFKTSKHKLDIVQNNVFDKYNTNVQFNELGPNSLNMQGMFNKINGYDKTMYLY